MSVADEIIRLQTAKADIKTAIEEKGVMVGDGTIDTYAEKIAEISSGGGSFDEGYEEGKKAQYDAFWDNFQHNQTNWCNFGRWHRHCFYPKYSMVLSGRQSDNFLLFDNYSDYTVGFDLAERLEECGITIDFSRATQTIRCFQNTKIGRLPELDFSSSNNLSNCFSNNPYLKTIDKLIVSEQAVFEYTFNNCPLLEDLTIEGTIAQKGFDVSRCPLSKASFISVINALSTETTALTVTLKKSAINTAFGINVDDPTTYPEGSEYYTLRNSKSNWTFNYA